MFTGIVTDLGTVREVQPIGGAHDMRLVIGTAPAFLAEPAPAAVGESQPWDPLARVSHIQQPTRSGGGWLRTED